MTTVPPQGAVIGSSRCKASVIEQGCVARLLQIATARSRLWPAA
jgi:hypothetical protein